MGVLIAGGGTGGHLYPGVAVAQELRRRAPETRILFVGTARGIEVKAVPRAGFELALLPVSGLRGKGLLAFVLGLLRLPLALWQAFKVVRRFRPSVAVSVGGYAAGPAVVVAHLMRVPCVVLEQNAVAGITNRLLGRIARRVVAALPTRGFAPHKVLVLGNPVRADFIQVRDVPYAVGNPLRLFVFGGSQGARALNDVMLEVAVHLAQRAPFIEVEHQTGSADEARMRAFYAARRLQNVTVKPFVFDMARAMAEAHLVLCRAGASTIAELAVCGRPAILVPFPFAVDDHQTANAEALVAAGGAVLLPQADLRGSTLADLIIGLAADRDRLCTMAAAARGLGRPQAVEAIADVVTQEAAHV